MSDTVACGRKGVNLEMTIWIGGKIEQDTNLDQPPNAPEEMRAEGKFVGIHADSLHFGITDRYLARVISLEVKDIV